MLCILLIIAADMLMRMYWFTVIYDFYSSEHDMCLVNDTY